MRISTGLPMTPDGVPGLAVARRLEDLGHDAIKRGRRRHRGRKARLGAPDRRGVALAARPHPR